MINVLADIGRNLGSDSVSTAIIPNPCLPRAQGLAMWLADRKAQQRS